MGAIVHFWANVVPESVLYHVIRLVMRFPEHAAKTTVRLLRNPMGVREVL